MAKKDSYEERAEALLEPIVKEYGCEVYDVEYVKEGSDWYLRAYIDKPEGVNIIDCENVSRAFSDKLDEEDFIADAYVLEVSSPGLGRALKKDRHLAKSIGEEVEVKTYKPIDGQKEFTGILKAFDKDTITIEMGIENNSETKDMTFAKSDIAVIRLTLDF
jgi:ribosome maturation factor RimP